MITDSNDCVVFNMVKNSKIQHFIKATKVRHKIILFYLVLVLLTVFISAVFYYQMSNRYIDEAIYDLSLSEIQSHNNGFQLLIEDVNTYSKEIISSPSIQTALDPNQKEIYQLKQVDQELAASMMFDNKISSIYVFDFQGKKYYRDKELFKNIQMKDIIDTRWYQDVLDAKGGYILNFNGDGLIRDEKKNYLSFLRLINSNVNHQPVGIMMINIDVDTIREVFNIEDSKYESVIIRDLVYDTEMTILNSVANESTIDMFETVNQAFIDVKEQSLLSDEVTIDNRSFNVTGIINEAYGLGIVEVRTGRDRQVLFADYNFIIIIIIIMNGALILVGSVWFSNYITNPITELTKSMKAVEEGTFEPVQVEKYHDEIGKLKEGYNFMIIEIQQLIEDKIREQQDIKEAELRVIMEQIKPHFLYNTLDSINSLIMLEYNEDAEKALTALSKFYRSSLSDGRSMVTLETEINIVKNYLLIQDIRYKDLFNVEYAVDDKVLDVKVPKLILQPLVENSLYHGLRPMGMDGIIKVSAWQAEEKLIIEVSDNGVGMTDEVKDKVLQEAMNHDEELSSIGLPATIRRIRILYKNSEFYIDNKGEGTCIHIEFPVLHEGAVIG